MWIHLRDKKKAEKGIDLFILLARLYYTYCFFQLGLSSSASHQPCWGAYSRPILMNTTMIQMPTTLAVRKGLFSCEFLARLQELCLHGSQCLLSAQASWLCQVRVTC